MKDHSGYHVIFIVIHGNGNTNHAFDKLFIINTNFFLPNFNSYLEQLIRLSKDVFCKFLKKLKQISNSWRWTIGFFDALSFMAHPSRIGSTKVFNPTFIITPGLRAATSRCISNMMPDGIFRILYDPQRPFSKFLASVSKRDLWGMNRQEYGL